MTALRTTSGCSSLVFISFLVFIFVGRAGADVADNESVLSGIRLMPEGVTLVGANASQCFVVLGTYSDGMERDVTDQCHFTLSDTAVARFDMHRRLHPLADGTTTLTAELSGISAVTTLRVADVWRQQPISFVRNIRMILTKQGCNASDCHGGVKGRGGFKLSLDALDPRADYGWILNGGGFHVLSPEPLEPKEPRINLENPEQSLLLLKPTGEVSHEGGLQLEPDSREFRILLDWIHSGAPYGDNDDDSVAHLEVTPHDVVVTTEGHRQILVTARLSSGRRVDFTDQVRYESLDRDVVKVTRTGLVHAQAPGEARVVVRAVDHVTVTHVRVVEQPVASYPQVSRVNYIDELVLSKLEKFRIVPSELSGDAEFLRRVCLDLTGTLPPPDRVREFLDNKSAEKRDALISVLLDSPEFIDYWTFRLSDLFRVNGYYGWVHQSWEWVRKAVARNRPYDQIARELIAAQGYNGNSRHFLLGDNKPAPVERVVAEQFRVFMGRRLDCAQCHNHPFDQWTQDQFWGLAAFYGRLTNTEWYGDNVVFDDPDGHEVDFGDNGTDGLVFRRVMHPRTKVSVLPTFPDGQVLVEDRRIDPRQELAEWITSQDEFAEAAVNRFWRYFFGRGVVEPVDDFRIDNPPTHPELLRVLATDFREHGCDLRHLMRRIVSSRTYQLSNQPNETNQDDVLNYSHALARPLAAEVLLDAISSVSGVPEVFSGGGILTGAAPPGTRAINLKLPADYPSPFLEIYGRPKRDAVPERDERANLRQALHTLAGTTYNDKLRAEGGRIDELLRNNVSDQEIIEQFYLAAFSRDPQETELLALTKLLAGSLNHEEAVTDLLWALINSREFAENH